MSGNGLSVLFAVVFMEAIGLPVPAALALLIAGGASGAGNLNPLHTVLTALAAMLLGDVIMFLVGRYTGWWLLGMLCRLSLNPESCIIRSADSFHKRGRVLLLFAKFIPGINTMAPPLAGSMNLPVMQFLGLDLVGASLYVSAFWGTGYVFSGLVGVISAAYARFGNVMGIVVGLLVAGWIAWHALYWVKAKVQTPVKLVTPAEVARRLPTVAIYDVRSHGYYERGTMRIVGSSRLEPNAIGEEKWSFPEGREIVLYCTCFREATSGLVARFLEEKGIAVSVLAGGFDAWKKAKLPLEPVPDHEIVELPTFA